MKSPDARARAASLCHGIATGQPTGRRIQAWPPMNAAESARQAAPCELSAAAKGTRMRGIFCPGTRAQKHFLPKGSRPKCGSPRSGAILAVYPLLSVAKNIPARRCLSAAPLQQLTQVWSLERPISVRSSRLRFKAHGTRKGPDRVEYLTFVCGHALIFIWPPKRSLWKSMPTSG